MITNNISNKDQKKHYLGHRERLRKKFCKSAAMLSDYEILELFLFHLIPYKDTKPIAKKLLETFTTFDGIAMAAEKNLCKIDGIGKLTAFAFKVLGELFTRRAKNRIKKVNVLDSFEAVLDYCKLNIGYKTQENVHILFLNKQYYLITDEPLFSGTIDETPFYSREILRKALELNSSAIIVVHNHPSGDTTPSSADIEQTHKLLYAAETIGIKLLDHIIVSPNSCTSLRISNLLKD
ncbi:MAG: DNA repair protein RadC [Holosporales bacterium]|jgi:DNA repair protein RadC|nr:DNA repair protein RadC [Holosporales bacterium]